MVSSLPRLGKSALEKLGVREYDRVRLKTGGMEVAGTVMPRTEFADRNALVLKLDNGYNVGISAASVESVEKAEQRLAAGKEKASGARKFSKDLPNVSLIATGGTIASTVDYGFGGVRPMLAPEDLLLTTPALAQVANFKSLLSPFSIASENMTPNEWITLAKLAEKELNGGVDGLLLTHGTDTLHFTSAALSFMLADLPKPVGLIGAQRSPDRGSFDGSVNLLCGAFYAARSDIAEVAIVMHGTSDDDYCYALRGTKARKMHTSRRDAFRPVNDVPLAKIWPDGRIDTLNRKYRKRGTGETVADAVFENKTAMLKAYPHSEPELLDLLVDKGYKGIVIEATALGHVQMSTLDPNNSWRGKIKRAIGEGVVLAVATQSLYGRTHPYVYEPARELLSQGVVFCSDMLPEVAYVKLGWLLGHEEYDNATVRELMAKNIAGEINERHTEEMFLY